MGEKRDMASDPSMAEITIGRRQTLKWFAALSAGLSAPLITSAGADSQAVDDWPVPELSPISAKGYGTDPDLVNPPQAWPLTLSESQRLLISTLADIIMPAQGEVPAASSLGVTGVVDEWVSAPYPKHQSDRLAILAGLAWLDREAQRRYQGDFLALGEAQRLTIIDDIAYDQTGSDLRFARMAQVFDGLRSLIVRAFYASPEGAADLGYEGNVPIQGDYPGPSPAATAHLESILEELGLAEHAYATRDSQSPA